MSDVLIHPDIDEKLRKVRLFLCDVDGVLTDATIVVGEEVELKQFHIRDGLGIKLLQQANIKVGWISHRTSIATAVRGEELKIDFLHHRPGSKVEAVSAVLEETGLSWEEVSFIGDDLYDLGAMKRAGVSFAVADGIDEVKAMADYVTKAAGGRGAVREAAEFILKAQGRWDGIVGACAI